MAGVTVPRAIMILFAGVRFFVTGRRVAASLRTVIAWESWPSGRKGMVMGTSV